MRPIFTFTFALFLLIACSSNAPAPTLTTISSTSTPNSQPATPNSPTPTIPPTETPAPTRTIDLQPLPPAWTAALGDQFELNQDGAIINKQTGDTIPELRLKPDGEMTRTYEYDGNKNFTLTLDPAKDITVLPNGNLDMQGWMYNSETGQMERKHPIYEGKEMKEVALSMPEMIETLRRETQKIKDANGGKLPDKYGKGSADSGRRLLGIEGTDAATGQGLLKYQDMILKMSNTYNSLDNSWNDNEIYIWNAVTGKYDKEPTLFYTYTAIDKDGTYGYLVLEGTDGKKSYFIDEEKINDHAPSKPNRPKGTGSPFRID